MLPYTKKNIDITILKKSVFIILLAFYCLNANSQIVKDTLKSKSIKPIKAIDTVKKKPSVARAAALRSAIFPGLGQIYNKKYWKLPLVYGAVAFPVVTFTYNLEWYNKTRAAYAIKFYNDTAKIKLPTDGLDQRLIPLSSGSLRLYRNSFRQGVDFSVLGLLVVWGLQVADAAVDAHLKGFNVNDDLSLKIKPWIAPTGSSSGISLVLSFRDEKPKSSILIK
jgi:TM2 domain-containing membrane protein YozV